jgi:hypothetical protein
MILQKWWLLYQENATECLYSRVIWPNLGDRQEDKA